MDKKLPLWTLKNTTFDEAKELFSQNENITRLKEYYRSEIFELVDDQKDEIEQRLWWNWSWDMILSSKYVNKLQKMIDEKQTYRKILEKYREDFSYFLLDKFIWLCKTPTEFKSLYEKENVKEVLVKWREQNVEKVWKLYNIQTPAEFENLCEEENVRYVLKYWREQNVEKAIWLCKTPAEFESLCEKENVRYVLERWREQNVEKAIWLCKTPAEFESLCENQNVKGVLVKWREQNVEQILSSFGIQDQKEIIENVSYEIINTIDYTSFKKRKNKRLWLFVESIKTLKLWEKWIFGINYDNFVEHIDSDEPLFAFAQDTKANFEWTIPWTKDWFAENPERKEYLRPESFETFKKMWTIVWLWIIEWSKTGKWLKKYYEYIFQNINLKESRNSILQLAELFNVVLRKGNYEIFDEIVAWLWKEFKKFIEKYSISNKWRTIVTLLIARTIRDSFQIWKNKDWKRQLDYSSIEKLLEWVKKELLVYEEILKRYDNVPIKTSIWVEIEIWDNTAKWYKESTWWDYKQDILTLSSYSDITNGNEHNTIHEIATKPTDNPYLQLLELQLLEEMDFLDLNFKKPDYEKWARTLHISVWWEYGVKYDKNADFIQNILVMTNRAWLHAWEKVSKINKYDNIRDRWNDVDVVFGDKKTNAVEYRSFDINKKWPFEKLMISVFNLNMAKQTVDKYLWEIKLEDFKDMKDIEDFRRQVYTHKLLKTEIKDERIIKLMYEFIKLQIETIRAVLEHNNNFVKNETVAKKDLQWLWWLLKVYNSTGPILQIFAEKNISIYNLKEIFEKGIDTETQIIEYLNWKIKWLTKRQTGILWKNYKLRIKPPLQQLKKENVKIYQNIEKYLNGNIQDTMRKISNMERFESVIWDDKEYLKNIRIPYKSLFERITPEFANKLIMINNLFTKKDSTNALSLYNTVVDKEWNKITDDKYMEMNIFDKKLRNIPTNDDVYYYSQWWSEKMLIHKIQRLILDFNKHIL